MPRGSEGDGEGDGDDEGDGDGIGDGDVTVPVIDIKSRAAELSTRVLAARDMNNAMAERQQGLIPIQNEIKL
jgi:hypothetical protein